MLKYTNNYKIGALVLLVVSNVFLWALYLFDVFNFKPIALYYSLDKWREIYMSEVGVSDINKNLPYVLGIVKLYFSPYFLPDKLSYIKGLGLLWVWGAFVNHVLLLFSIKGIYEYFKINKRNAVLFVIPIVSFLLLYGYLAPYSGRQRDSFIGILIMFSCYGIITFFSKNRISANIQDEDKLKVQSNA